MSIDPAQTPNEPEEDVPFGASRLPPAAIFGLIAAVLPFVLKFESWSSSSVNGVRSVSYSEPVAMGGGIVAVICGVLLLVGAIRKPPRAPDPHDLGPRRPPRRRRRLARPPRLRHPPASRPRLTRCARRC